MPETIIKRPISLESKYLTSKYREHIFDKIVRNTTDDCTHEFGYILKVIELCDILEHGIAPGTSDNLFIVTFKVDAIKPAIGVDVVGQVCMVFESGLLVMVADRFKVLVPASSLTNYVISDDGSRYVKSNMTVDGPRAIEWDDDLKIRITNAKYRCDKKSFSVVGEILS